MLAVAASHKELGKPVPEGGPTPPISILRPLKGLDDGLYENLLSLVEQDYPHYEILLGAEDPHDPALDCALRLKKSHPEVPISVVVTRKGPGRNPKVRILRELERRAKHGWLLVSDSNVRVDKTYLRDTAAELRDDRVKLVTNPVAPLVSADETLGGTLESLHLATFVVASTCFARVMGGRALVVGKSMLMERAALTSLGGFASVSNVLAEDYLLGRKFELEGYGVALSSHPVRTVNESWPVERFLQRHLRWGQMRRRISLAAYAGELLLNPIAWLAAAVLVRGSALRPAEAVAALVLLAFKLVLDVRLAAVMRQAPLPMADAAWLPLKDLLIAALWPIGLVRRTIRWRGNELRIGRLSRLFVPRRRARDLVGEAA
ncbi:MAG: glycosyltransferase [Deltaproteobacteria bacterium]|nr:glycosyltransferase [Deltaproteobacteria bacterium]